MNYIVLDMEWNQPWPGSPSARKVLPVQIRGEILQIGAVRITEDQQVADEFQVLIRPKYYRRLNRRVSKLTGIKESQLREQGVTMEEAMEAFFLLSRYEGIIPAIESAHAVAYGLKLAGTMEHGSVLINLSGRGDKDMDYVIENYGIR